METLRFRRSVGVHVLCWIGYAFYFYLVNRLGSDKINVGLVMITVPYYAVVFYSVWAILEYIIDKARYLLGSVLLISFYLLSATLIYGLTYGPQEIFNVYSAYHIPGKPINLFKFLQTMLVMHGNFSVYAVLYYLHRRRLREAELKLLEMQNRIQAEYQRDQYEFVSLAQQISAHTMANVFEHWRLHLTSSNEVLAEQIKGMYELMVYYMQAHAVNAPTRVLLGDEIVAVKKYIAIQRLVSSQEFDVQWKVSGNSRAATVPPTILLTLIENALKHGDHSESACPTRVIIVIGHSKQTITVTNAITNHSSGLTSHQIGLYGLRRRLDILYEDNYSMVLDQPSGEFRVQIIIGH